MSSFRSIMTAFTAAALLLAFCRSSVGGELADGEREFVQQLLDRAMFDLAEQFCRRHLESPNDVNERAEWELILSECQQQHAWSMDEDSRSGMISESAQRITEFLRTNTPVPDKSLLLRVRQIELLIAAGLMEAELEAPLSNPMATGIPRKSAGALFVREALSQAGILAEALLKLMDEIRADIDAAVLRSARERTRFVLAQVGFLRSELAAPGDEILTSEQQEAMLEQLQKSASDDELRFRCRLMLANIQLKKGDFATFRLRYENVQAVADSPGDRARLAALKIRSLLRQSLPSEALQEYVRASRDGLTLTQELQTLRLQGLLQLVEVLHQLEESPERREMIDKTTREFLQTKENTLALTSGVWRQRCLRIVDHFERVQQVGPEAAWDLAQASTLIEAGDVSGARKLLQSLIQKLGGRDQKLAATVMLQSGNLSVRLHEWSNASVDLQQATQLFQEVKDDSRAAAADLLRVFVIGQQWDSAAVGISERDYQSALEEHLTKFPDQPTTVKAREWRARLWRSTDPLKAAAELLAISSSDNDIKLSLVLDQDDPENLLRRLCLAGDFLLEAMSRDSDSLMELSAGPDTTAALTLRSQSDLFLAASQQVLRNDSLQGTWPRLILESQALGLTLQNQLPITADWSAMRTSAQKLQHALNNQRALLPQAAVKSGVPEKYDVPVKSNTDMVLLSKNAETICHALIVLSSARQLLAASDYELSRLELFRLPFAERMRIVQQLLHQIALPGKLIPGDLPLAHLLIDIVNAERLSDPHLVSIEMKIVQLSALQPLCAALGKPEVADRCLNELLGLPLTDSQVERIAAMVTRTTVNSASKQAVITSRRFWQTVQKRTKPGQEVWFEASLQLALIAEAEGTSKEAGRILGVVSVLHPDWGSNNRKERAHELRLRLEKSP